MLIEGLEQADLLNALLASALVSLPAYASKDPLKLPAPHRLAFRELGLSIGLHGIGKMPGLLEQAPDNVAGKRTLHSLIERLMQYTVLSQRIETFWLDPNNHGSGWTTHREINMVMLATSLAPYGYLSL